MTKIITICGLIGSGKDTAADYLCNFHEFRRESFASALKDVVSAVFGWDRELLEGRTKESRKWREQVDPWWAKRLGMPELTPRWVLQYWGTEVCRKSFHNDIWIASLENRLRSIKDNVVISDCRFPNEIQAARSQGGCIIRITRGPDPEWFGIASTTPELMPALYPSVHSSEWAWASNQFDAVIDNNGTIEQLYAQIKNFVPLD